MAFRTPLRAVFSDINGRDTDYCHRKSSSVVSHRRRSSSLDYENRVPLEVHAGKVLHPRQTLYYDNGRRSLWAVSDEQDVSGAQCIQHVKNHLEQQIAHLSQDLLDVKSSNLAALEKDHHGAQSLRDQISCLQQQITLVNEQKKEQEVLCNSYRDRYEASVRSVRDLETQLAEFKVLGAALRQAKDTQVKSAKMINKAQTAVKALHQKSRADRLQFNAETGRDRIRDLESQLARLTDEHRSLLQVFAIKDHELEVSRSELQQANDRHDAELKSLQRALELRDRDIDQQARMLERLNQLITFQKSEFEKLRQEAVVGRNLAMTVNDLRSELKLVQETKKFLENEKHVAVEEINDLRTERHQLQLTNGSLTNKLELLERQRRELEVELAYSRNDAEFQLRSWNEETADTKEAIDELSHDLGDLKTNLLAQYSHWQKLCTEAVNAEKQMNQIVSMNFRNLETPHPPGYRPTPGKAQSFVTAFLSAAKSNQRDAAAKCQTVPRIGSSSSSATQWTRTRTEERRGTSASNGVAGLQTEERKAARAARCLLTNSGFDAIIPLPVTPRVDKAAVKLTSDSAADPSNSLPTSTTSPVAQLNSSEDSVEPRPGTPPVSHPVSTLPQGISATPGFSAFKRIAGIKPTPAMPPLPAQDLRLSISLDESGTDELTSAVDKHSLSISADSHSLVNEIKQLQVSLQDVEQTMYQLSQTVRSTVTCYQTAMESLRTCLCSERALMRELESDAHRAEQERELIRAELTAVVRRRNELEENLRETRTLLNQRTTDMLQCFDQQSKIQDLERNLLDALQKCALRDTEIAELKVTLESRLSALQDAHGDADCAQRFNNILAENRRLLDDKSKLLTSFTEQKIAFTVESRQLSEMHRVAAGNLKRAEQIINRIFQVLQPHAEQLRADDRVCNLMTELGLFT